MGGAVSAGEDNDNLVENLVSANYIRTPKVIEIFRAVDRGHYYLKGQRNSAYHDMAWKFNHLHLSAPCIYSEVMEHLDLKPGMSFLNLGSGTGYLSTMAGLVLGCNGINHGIEIYPDVVEYANARLKEFLQKAPAFDRFEFCRPQFQVGNCLLLPPEPENEGDAASKQYVDSRDADTKQYVDERSIEKTADDTPGYDRIYCGAACPSENANYLMNLLNIGGKLVLPLEDHLQVKTRIGEQEWDSKSVLAVSFATLIPPNNGNNNKDTKILKPPDRNVLRLQELCRFCIRRVIRSRFNIEMPPKKEKTQRERRPSLGLDEQIMARRREARRLRRRRINTAGESSSRRRRMNTSGDSDHGHSSDSSDSSSGVENDNDIEMSEENIKDTKPSSLESKSISSETTETQNDELTKDTNDITLSDPENEKPDLSTNSNDALKKDGTSKKDKKSKGKSSKSRKLRLGFLRSKSKNAETSNQDKGDASSPTTETKETKTFETGTTTERLESEEVEIQPWHLSTTYGEPQRRDHLAYLLHGLRRISRSNNMDRAEAPQTLQEAMDEAESNEEKEKSENSDSDSDGIFTPLAETSFTIAIRKLPLPPSLINFMLYNRQ